MSVLSIIHMIIIIIIIIFSASRHPPTPKVGVFGRSVEGGKPWGGLRFPLGTFGRKWEADN
jgi:hypothetical protein